MVKSVTKWRLPRLRIGLRAFLVLAAMSGPVVAAVYWRYFADEVRSMGGSVPTGEVQVQRAAVDIVFRESRFGNKREVLHVVVRIMTPISDRSWGTESIDGAPLYVDPLEQGISCRQSLVFIDGKLWTAKTHPCFLVFDPASRTFVEIPITSQVARLATHEEVTQLPEWRRDVVPVLRRIHDEAVRSHAYRSKPSN